jgi:hypothetical protein
MDSSRIYLELMESSERMMKALAEERRLRLSINLAHPFQTTCRERYGNANRKLESAAECYVTALGSFREALLAEFGVSSSKKPKQAPSAACRAPERAQSAQERRKKLVRGEEGFPLSTRALKA